MSGRGNSPLRVFAGGNWRRNLWYASRGNPAVVIHLLRALGRLAPFLNTPEQRDALAAQANAAVEEALHVLTLETNRSAAVDSYASACEALGRPALLAPARTPAR